MKKCIVLLISLLFFQLDGLNAQKLISAIDLGVQTRNDVPPEFGFLMPNPVQSYKLVYETTDTKGNTVQASGLAVFPTAEGFAFPVAIYQHGTVAVKQQVPSNLSAEAIIGWVFSSNNYIVLLPDYLGFGENEEDIHPYVHAATQASAAVDMLYAARDFAAQKGYVFNDQLFVTGYSQGGHAAAALHQELQANFSEDFTVTASAPMSGPYNISGEMVELILSEEPYEYPEYLANVFVSYNLVYELYDSSAQLFKPPYAGMVDEFRANEIELAELGTRMSAQLNADYGASITRNMIQDSILTVLTEKDPFHPLIQALEDNDVYDWAPEAPTRLYYCQGDDQVVYTNSVVADSAMNANGASDVRALNLGTTLNHTECVAPALLNGLAFFATFQNLVTDVDDFDAPSDPKIFPNPARDWIQLQGIKAGAAISLFNSKGQMIKEVRSEGEAFTLDVPELHPGLYWVRIVEGKQSWTKEVVIGE